MLKINLKNKFIGGSYRPKDLKEQKDVIKASLLDKKLVVE